MFLRGARAGRGTPSKHYRWRSYHTCMRATWHIPRVTCRLTSPPIHLAFFGSPADYNAHRPIAACCVHVHSTYKKAGHTALLFVLPWLLVAHLFKQFSKGRGLPDPATGAQ